ncbi:hypothetical protein [Actinomadura sp. WMMA1423]|uniref:hypothetical protein n=1 Tax=Actinomadura sp. WMMA1423 TaxID=2591108 RepID=UPI00114672DD|nr:hypothetical protein [Actinomadura sp. WMMA1423]
MERVLTAARPADSGPLNITAGLVHLLIVVDRDHKGIEVILTSNGSQSAAAASKATLDADTLTVPGGSDAATEGDFLTVTVLIPEGLQVIARTSGGITTAGRLVNARLHTDGGHLKVDRVEGVTMLTMGRGFLTVSGTSGVLKAVARAGDIYASDVTGVADFIALNGTVFVEPHNPTLLSIQTTAPGGPWINGPYAPENLCFMGPGGIHN